MYVQRVGNANMEKYRFLGLGRFVVEGCRIEAFFVRFVCVWGAKAWFLHLGLVHDL